MKKIVVILFVCFAAISIRPLSAQQAKPAETEKEKEAGKEPAAAKPNPFKTAGLAIAGYFTNPEVKQETQHLEAMNPFGLSILPSSFGMGLAMDFPIGIADMFGQKSSPWKDSSGYVKVDLDKIYQSAAIKRDGLDFNLEFFMKDMLSVEFGFGGGNSAAGVAVGSLDARFDLNISEDLFKTLADGIEQGSYSYGVAISGAVFVEDLSVNYNHKGFYGKLPGLFFSATATWFTPLMYIPRSNLSVKLDNASDREIDMYLEGAAEMYTSVDPSNPGAMGDLGGLDLSLQAEYALFKIMDVGVTVWHVPFIPAVLHHGKKLEWTQAQNQIMKIEDLANGKMTIETDNVMKGIELSGEFDSVNYVVLRPMRWDFYALFRPLRRDILTLRPNIGFTVITPSKDPYFNLGLEVQCNVGRWFTASWFTGGYDGLCRNRLGMDIHIWRIARLITGLEMRSQDYGGAWTLKGAAFELGLKWGGGYRGVTNF